MVDPAPLTVNHLVKCFPKSKRNDRVFAVDGIDLDVPAGSFVTLLGPSGCGKTTTLRSIAGLERPDEGEIEVAGRVLFSASKGIHVPSARRGLGMVFQSYAVWPHMNVFNNVAFPLKVMPRNRRGSRKAIRERVERVLGIVRMEHLADRPATNLSGGQQQRLALARALVMEPPVLLLDEPLSNLDAKLREAMVFELKRLQRELEITTVYVTHDQSEALAMSNKIAVMRSGKIEQLGSPREVYQNPKSRFVADFIGTTNLTTGVVVEALGSDRYLVNAEPGVVEATTHEKREVGDKVLISVRPEHVELHATPPSETRPGHWTGVVSVRVFLGESIQYEVRCGDEVLRIRSSTDLSIRPDTAVTVVIPPEKAIILPVEEAADLAPLEDSDELDEPLAPRHSKENHPSELSS